MSDIDQPVPVSESIVSSATPVRVEVVPDGAPEMVRLSGRDAVRVTQQGPVQHVRVRGHGIEMPPSLVDSDRLAKAGELAKAGDHAAALRLLGLL